MAEYCVFFTFLPSSYVNHCVQGNLFSTLISSLHLERDWFLNQWKHRSSWFPSPSWESWIGRKELSRTGKNRFSKTHLTLRISVKKNPEMFSPCHKTLVNISHAPSTTGIHFFMVRIFDGSFSGAWFELLVTLNRNFRSFFQTRKSWIFQWNYAIPAPGLFSYPFYRKFEN